MPRLYSLLPGTYITLSVFLAALMILAAIPVQAQQGEDSAFTVRGVKVDVTAENAVTARRQAFDRAQRDALRTLAERMLSPTQLEAFEPPEAAAIAPMVNDFEITEEQLSTVRYIATYTFRFNSNAVRNYFGQRGLTYTDTASRPVLVLPYYEAGNQTMLWQGHNPWLAAWRGARTGGGLVPVRTPMGDIADISDIAGHTPLNYDPRRLESMALRYDAGDALILVASPAGGLDTNGQPGALTVNVYSTDQFPPQYLRTVRVGREDVSGDETIFSAGVRKVRQSLQDSWRNESVVGGRDMHRQQNLDIRVRFSQMREWLETQQALRRVQGVNDIDVTSITPSEARVRLAYQGSESRLRLALQENDLVLNQPGHGSAVHELYLSRYAPAGATAPAPMLTPTRPTSDLASPGNVTVYEPPPVQAAPWPGYGQGTDSGTVNRGGANVESSDGPGPAFDSTRDYSIPPSSAQTEPRRPRLRYR